MGDLDPATIFAPRFNALGAPWAATGSIASMIYGEIRVTHDIDIIILLDGEAIAALERVFPEDEFYRPPRDVVEIERARDRRGHFNIIILKAVIRPMFISAQTIRSTAGHSAIAGPLTLVKRHCGWRLRSM